jgi:REP element-mobilizing transposase RayT
MDIDNEYTLEEFDADDDYNEGSFSDHIDDDLTQEEYDALVAGMDNEAFEVLPSNDGDKELLNDKELLDEEDISENTNENLFFMWLVRYSNKELEPDDWDEYLEMFQDWCKEFCKNWTFQLELTINEAGENNYHIQGAITLKEKKRFSYLMKRFNAEDCAFKGIHLEPAKDYKALTEYCSKNDDTKVSRVYSNKNNGYVPDDIVNADLRFWQEQIFYMLANEPNPRKVIILLDDGNTGKSFFINWILCHEDFKDKVAIIPEGTSQQINGCCRNALQSGHKDVWIFDQMRANRRMEQVENQYKIIESIKSRRLEPNSMYSGANGGVEAIILPPSHVIVMCNKLYKTMLSSDRYEIYKVCKDDVSNPNNYYLKPVEL